MSRTFRAKRGDQFGALPWGRDGRPGNPWKLADATIALHFHSDVHDRDGPRGQQVKRKITKIRRADIKDEFRRILELPEQDFLDRERGYGRIYRWFD